MNKKELMVARAGAVCGAILFIALLCLIGGFIKTCLSNAKAEESTAGVLVYYTEDGSTKAESSEGFAAVSQEVPERGDLQLVVDKTTGFYNNVAVKNLWVKDSVMLSSRGLFKTKEEEYDRYVIVSDNGTEYYILVPEE